MYQYIIASEEGRTLTPNDRICENLQILGFSNGNNEKEAIESFVIHMEDDDFFEIEGWSEEKLVAYKLAGKIW